MNPGLAPDLSVILSLHFLGVWDLAMRSTVLKTAGLSHSDGTFLETSKEIDLS